MAELQDNTAVYVVYDNKGKLFLRKVDTRMTTVVLFEEHMAKVDAGRNYISAVAWFYTEAEAQAYIDKAKGGAPC